jgi:Tfp pilus assembly protein PilF
MNKAQALLLIFLLQAVLFATFAPIQAQTQPESLASVAALEGTAFARLDGAPAEQALSLGAQIFPGTQLRVERYSRLALRLTGGGYIRLAPLSQLHFPKEPGRIVAAAGESFFFNRAARQFPEIQTPLVTAAIRGTEFFVSVSSQQVSLAVIEGALEASNSYGSLSLAKAQALTVKPGEAPQARTLLELQDSVQWAFAVPLIGDWREYIDAGLTRPEFREAVEALRMGQDASLSQLTPSEARFLKAARFCQQGQLEQALAQLEGPSLSPPERLLRARLLLHLGELQQGMLQLRRLEQEAPNFAAASAASRALALLAVGQPQAARQELMITQEREPTSYSALAVLSLLAQAQRDLPRAQALVVDALQHYPDSEYLLARQAELLFASGRVPASYRLIQKACAGSCQAATLSTKGFIELALGETKRAEQSFGEALQHDSSEASAFLGLGLAQFRSGSTEQALAYLEQAVLLDPQRAVFRSYLGKAFSQLNLEDKAQQEFALAIERDPNDPTPWLYRSYSQFALNRPVAALFDLEESIVRNQQRAVFRSSLLLDEDAAVRSASLGRVFQELGFEDAGRVEAYKALARNYSDFAAHRLLADTQQTVFLADAAASERRIADLFAPLNFNLFDSISPTLSFNEYSALFERDETRYAIGADYSSKDDLYSPQFLLAGKDEDLGYALSAGAAFQEGSVSNNSNQDYRLTSQLQYQLGWGQRLSGSVSGLMQRTRDTNAFEQDADLESVVGDIGYLHDFGGGSKAVLNLAVERNFEDAKQYGAQDSIISTQIFGGIEDSLQDDVLLDNARNGYVTATRLEGQLLSDGAWLSQVLGAGLQRFDTDRFNEALVLEDQLGELTGKGVTLPSVSQNDVASYSFYSYQTLHAASFADLTLGAAFEHTERELREVPTYFSGTEDQQELSPRLGLLLYPSEAITLRAAYREGLSKSLLEDNLSIEPSQLGGLNQRFNDLSGTRVRQFGIGADAKDAQSTYLGAEWIRRNLIEPFNFASSEFIVDFDQEALRDQVVLGDTADYHLEQDFIRAYLSQVLAQELVGTLEYRFANQRSTDPDSFERSYDHRLGANLRKFWDSGLILEAQGFWRYQDRVGNLQYADGSEAFFHFDLGLRYRFAKRAGTFGLELRNIFDQSFELDQSSGFEEQLNEQRALYLQVQWLF